MLWSARVKQAVQSKRMSEQCERMSERTSKWPSTLRVDFMPFLPKEQRWRTGGGSSGDDGGGAQWDEIVRNRRVHHIDSKAGYTAADASGSAISLIPAARLCSCVCACVSAHARVCVFCYSSSLRLC